MSKVDANGKITLTAIRKGGAGKGGSKLDTMSSMADSRGLVERVESIDDLEK